MLFIIFPLIFLFAAFSSSMSTLQSYKMPIRKFGNSSVLTNGGIRHLEKILNRRKSDKQFHGKGLDGGKFSYDQDIHNYLDLVYVAEITMGNPPQEFTMQLNTDQCYTWVIDKSCNNNRRCFEKCYTDHEFCTSYCDGYCCEKYPKDKSNSCEKKQKFDSSISETYKKMGESLSIEPKIGINKFIDGFIGKDILRLAGMNEFSALTIPNFGFIQVTNMDIGMRYVLFDGALGLSYQSNLFETPISAAIKKGLLAKPLFTVFLATQKSRKIFKKDGGMITYGGMDSENCRPVQGWTPMTSGLEYSFQIQGVSYGNKYKMTKKQRVISGLGFAMIIGERRIVNSLAEYAGAKYDEKLGLYFIDCNAHYEPITFTISGKQYNITKEVLTLLDGDRCLFGMLPSNYVSKVWPGAKWILGEPFMRQYCHIHDIGNNRMGFAPSLQPK